MKKLSLSMKKLSLSKFEPRMTHQMTLQDCQLCDYDDEEQESNEDDEFNTDI